MRIVNTRAIYTSKSSKRATPSSYVISSESVSDLKFTTPYSPRYFTWKRMLDLLFTICLLFVLLIPSLVIMCAVFADDPGSVFFTQKRIGFHGNQFLLYKFRTMKMDTPRYIPTYKLKNPEQYLTRVGGFLRKYSLDEIPQLINVLKGDMSLIGPRPLICGERQIHVYRAQFGVYNVYPGITGLAQINGRDFVSAADKVRWDVQYVENFSFKQDFRIFLATVPKVCVGAGVIVGRVKREGNEDNF